MNNVTDWKIAQVMAEQIEYDPKILNKEYPEDIKWALWIKAPKWDILSQPEIYRILNMFPQRHDILQPVKVLVLRKRDLVDEIIRGDIDIRNIDFLEDKIKQRILALFPKKEINKTRHWKDPFLIRCANKYRNALKKIEFLRKVRTLSLDVSDIIWMSWYKGKDRFKILNKYNQLLEKNWQWHRKLVIETTQEEKKDFVKALKMLKSNYIDDPKIITKKIENLDKKMCNACYFDSVSVLIGQITERNIIKYSSTKKECENFLKFHKTISSTTLIYYPDDIKRVNTVLDCLIRELSAKNLNLTQ